MFDGLALIWDGFWKDIVAENEKWRNSGVLLKKPIDPLKNSNNCADYFEYGMAPNEAKSFFLVAYGETGYIVI